MITFAMDEQRCRVRGVFLSMSEAGAAAPTVLLDLPGGDCIPIYIGLWEAISIRNAIKGEVLPRPITHDLFVEVLRRLHATVTALSIDSLEEGIFFAKLHVKMDGVVEVVDCRPSDGIAIALRTDAPITVEESVVSLARKKREDLQNLQDLDSVM
ncbi:MAG TPA: bifunctional nuclease family protein [Methanomicrobiales archaeon]|jgi:bifunctional DNase/RNase|nr:bifunctional nuclease family protein [Methanomicrobiales archaeon]